MSSDFSFSERHGLSRTPIPISIRNEVPDSVRRGIMAVAIKSGFTTETIRVAICSALDELPDTANNWSSPNVLRECEELLGRAEWFEVYDVCEVLANRQYYEAEKFERQLNKLFEKRGVGWKMVNGELVVRGEKDYEKTTLEAKDALKTAGCQTASDELSEALADLSRRPSPDVTGAVHHSVAALECLAKTITGDRKATLGKILNKLNLPPTIKIAVEKMWAFASDQGRHVAEGRKPEFPEAMLTVHFCSALITYLLEKNSDESS